MSAPAPPLLTTARRGPQLATVMALVDDHVRVRMSGSEELLVARSLVPIRPADLGREAAVEFIAGDPTRPLILGLLHAPGPPADRAEPVELVVDGHQVVVQAGEQLSIRCGKASITLEAGGRVVIKGAQILTQASGSNRIRGSSIQLN